MTNFAKIVSNVEKNDFRLAPIAAASFFCNGRSKGKKKIEQKAGKSFK